MRWVLSYGQYEQVVIPFSALDSGSWNLRLLRSISKTVRGPWQVAGTGKALDGGWLTVR